MKILLVAIFAVFYLFYTKFISSYIDQKPLFRFFIFLDIIFLIVLESLFYHILGQDYPIFKAFYTRILVIIFFGAIGAWLSKTYYFNKMHGCGF